MSLNLEDLVLAVADDGHEVQNDILGLHVQDKGVGQRAGLASVNVEIVGYGRQVAQNASGRVHVLGQSLGGGQHAANEGDVDGPIFVVLDLNDCLGGVAVDELDAKVRVGEDGANVDLQTGAVGGRCGRVLRL